jgi:hypothetical protein
LIGGVAASAAVRTFPFRVFSFPSEIETGNWKGLILDPYPGPLQTPHLFAIDESTVNELIRQQTLCPGMYFREYRMNDHGVHFTAAIPIPDCAELLNGVSAPNVAGITPATIGFAATAACVSPAEFIK